MKTEPFDSTSLTSGGFATEKSLHLPSIVKNVAVRFAWVTQRSEEDVLALLSRPFSHNVVTEEDQGLLLAHFPFMQPLSTGMSSEDFTIMLVMSWVRIEALYRQGIVLPTQIMRGLMQKKDNHVST